MHDPAIEPTTAAIDLPERIGDFTILRVIGEGGMGVVYLAEDVRLGRKAAIKTMKLALAAKPENRARFIREARAAATVEHDNIVPIWQVGETADGSPFIAMPFLQGEMLETRLKRRPIQPLAIILKVACEVAEGLAAAHAQGLVHRDVKPGNIWIEGDPAAPEIYRQVRRCKILDFGLARSIATDDAHVTDTGVILGTPAYMAPEQASGADVDARADLFSLGAMLYRMATGRLPFHGPNTMAVLAALATVTPPPARSINPDLPPALSDLIDRLLCKDPAGRPRSATEVAAIIRRIAKEARTVDTPTIEANADTVPIESAVRPAPKTGLRRVLILAALGLLILVPLGGWLATVPAGKNDNGTPVDPERAAALWVLSLEGTVKLNGQDAEIKTAGDLPREQFELTGIDLHGNSQLTEEGALHLKGCPHLRDVDLHTTSIGDATLALLKDCPDLERLDVRQTQVTDAGLAYLKDHTLTRLWLGATKITDAGLAAFENWKDLRELNLDNTPTGDLGLSHFKGCTGLTHLDLRGTKVSDAGLAYFTNCSSLTSLLLGNAAKVTDAGLLHFKDCAGLAEINVEGTQVTDAGLTFFKDRTNLRLIQLSGPKVTDATLALFQHCKDLRELTVTEAPISAAGMAYFRGCTRLTTLMLNGCNGITPEGMVPFKDCPNLTTLAGCWRLADAGLAHFKGCTSVEVLWLAGMGASDVGLNNFKECKNLRVLRVGRTVVTDEGLALFQDCPTLTLLDVRDLKITNAGLAHFRGCTRLAIVFLGGTPVSDAGLAAFRNCKELQVLSLEGAPIGDAGLAHLRNLPRLKWVLLGGTKVTDAGLGHVQTWKSLETLNLKGLPIGDVGLAHLEDLPKLQILTLESTRVSNIGLVHLERLPNLKVLSLEKTRVSDPGLAHLRKIRTLASLNLNGTDVTPEGVARFKSCPGLTNLSLKWTNVTSATIEDLCQTLPQCWIDWDGP
jgi:tRNA A-37 threonylcarbamoyl transferase component Bud32/Leucine-rich repeat (LRR) protein